MKKITVELFGASHNQIDCCVFSSIEEARAYIIEEVAPILEIGDTVEVRQDKY